MEFAHFRLHLASGEKVLLAEAENIDEHESLEALRDTICSVKVGSEQHRAEGSDRNEDAAGGGSRTLRCDNCQALVAPADTATVECGYCGSAVEVPPQIRQGVRVGLQLTRDREFLEHLVSGHVHRFDGVQSNLYLLAAGIPMTLTWPLCAFLAHVLLRDRALDQWLLVSLVVAPLSLVAVIFALLRAHMANRSAVRLLAVRFGAVPPERAGEPRCCRSCDAPLPQSPHAIVVCCGFYKAYNLVFFDLRPKAAAVAELATTDTSLEETLQQQRIHRLFWIVLAALAAVLVVIALGYLFAKLP